MSKIKEGEVKYGRAKNTTKIYKRLHRGFYQIDFGAGIMKFSVICFVVTLVLGLLTMGLLGQVLYYLISPILNLKFPPMSSWHGDWVWPALYYVSMLWPFGFLISGWAKLLLIKFGWPKIVLHGTYICILFIWDLFLWFMVLNLLPKNKLLE